MIRHRNLQNLVPRSGQSPAGYQVVDFPSWMEDAVCSETDPDAFYPDKGSGGDHGNSGYARKVCKDCPVQIACLEYALDNKEVFGIWGGTTAQERRKLQRLRSRQQGAVA